MWSLEEPLLKAIGLQYYVGRHMYKHDDFKEVIKKKGGEMCLVG